MSKLSKKLVDNYNNTSNSVKKANKKHQKSVDDITEFIKPLVDKQRNKGTVGRWRITGVEIRYDEEIDPKHQKGNKYEYIEITEEEYDRDFTYSNRGTGKISFWGEPPEGFEEEYVNDYILEPEYKDIFKKRIEKRYKYLRVNVYESWGYGGEDWIHYDFLLTDILDDVGLRKEKLEKLEKLKP